jgi:hypothetical protein
MKLQFTILKDYINFSKSRIISTLVLFEFTEILIILKKNFILYFSQTSLFDFSNENLKLAEKGEIDFHIPREMIELFCIYIELVTKLIQNSNIITSDKLLNETFIICPTFLEVIKFVLVYIFTRDISDRLDLKNSSVSMTVSTRKLSAKKILKCTLMNFLRDFDINNLELKNNLTENYKFFVSSAISIVNYFYSCSNFFHKINKQESLEKSSKFIIEVIENDEKESSKYWICSTRDFLKTIYYFVESKNGLLYEYITEYGSYMKVRSESYSNNLKSAKQSLSCIPINFPLTRSILTLLHSVFDFSHK